MKKYILYACLSVLITAPALAENLPELNDEACRLLVVHQPQSDVEYRPSLDVNGKPVVEADLNKPNIDLSNNMNFDLTIDAARYTGLEMPEGSEAITNLGTIGLQEDGALTFNGEPMSGEAEASLRAFCAEKGHFIQEKQPNVELQKP